MLCLHVCLCTKCVPGAFRGQKRASGTLASCEPPRGPWELNPAPLQEQLWIFTSESSLQPLCLPRTLKHFFLIENPLCLICLVGQQVPCPWSYTLFQGGIEPCSWACLPREDILLIKVSKKGPCWLTVSVHAQLVPLFLGL